MGKCKCVTVCVIIEVSIIGILETQASPQCQQCLKWWGFLYVLFLKVNTWGHSMVWSYLLCSSFFPIVTPSPIPTVILLCHSSLNPAMTLSESNSSSNSYWTVSRDDWCFVLHKRVFGARVNCDVDQNTECFLYQPDNKPALSLFFPTVEMCFDHIPTTTMTSCVCGVCCSRQLTQRWVLHCNAFTQWAM